MSAPETRPLKIAVAGLGTVGGGVIKTLAANAGDLAARSGRPLAVVAVSARDAGRKRGFDMSKLAFAADPVVLAASDADIVVELIGGDEGPALALVEAALNNGKHVVTANKALLSKHGARLAALAERNNLSLRFEAAVAGGIPIVKALRESLVAYGVDAVRGILNGTCNYILTQMESTGRAFADVLADAQRLGYAEADPTLDVGGGDTAHKLSLLSALAFGVKPDLSSTHIQGITAIAPDDINFAREFGYRIKLLGVARRSGAGIDQHVGPAMVRAGTPLADVEGAFNAVLADAGAAGPFFFEGRGAGEAPTASAVIADIVDIARGASGPVFGRRAMELGTLSHAPSPSSAFYLRFAVLDEPGVLAGISASLAQAGVSIESMVQRGHTRDEKGRAAVSIVMITHDTDAASIGRALQAIARSDKVQPNPCVIPMESA